jgi:hypothetical protein
MLYDMLGEILQGIYNFVLLFVELAFELAHDALLVGLSAHIKWLRFHKYLVDILTDISCH